MKRALLHTLALVSLGITALAVTPAHAQTTANGPYYATPSWDQTLPASTRFIVLSNMNSEAVLDRDTGLVWQRSPPDGLTTSWSGANDYCVKLVIGNRIGWRVPTIQEFSSLFDAAIVSPPGFPLIMNLTTSLPTGHPFNVSAFDFWTATSASLAPNYVWGFNRFSGPSQQPKDQGGHVWCVRSGQPGSDPQ